MIEPAVIVHTGPNHLVLGEPDGSVSARLQAAVAMFKRGGVDARMSNDLRRDIWQKLVLNASGNTLAALSRVDLGGLGADPALCALSIDIMREAMTQAKKSRLFIIDKLKETLPARAELSPSRERRWRAVAVVAVAAALGWDLRADTDVEAAARRGKPGQRPSMLQDVLKGRPMEVEALLGQIQAFAREQKIAVPTIDVILPLLRGLDRTLRAN